MKKIEIVIQELFYVLTGALVIFVLMEIVWPGLVLAYINVNWVLILWVIAGMIVLTHTHNT